MRRLRAGNPTCTLLASAALIVSTPALATDEPGVGDIIVTAQKRNESVNKVGMSITAVSGDDLISRGVADTSDLAKIVPGFTFTPSQYNSPVYSIRGIGFYESSLAATPAVTVYTDEVPIPFPSMTKGAALDLERVEILKGPQGTLFGQNSTGGAVNYIAAKPTDHPTAGFDAGFGRFASFDGQGFVSGPLTDTLRIRVAGRAQMGSGWQRSYTRDDTNGGVEQYQGRILVEWHPSETVRFSLNLNGFLDRGEPQAGQLLRVTPQNPATAYPFVLAYPLSPMTPRAADWTPGFPFRDDKYAQAALRAEVDLSDAIILTSISAYEHFRTSAGSDFDGMDGPTLDVATRGKIVSFNQELRLTGEVGPLRWILGANYERDRVGDNQSLFVFNSSGSPTFPGLTPRYEVGSNFSQQNMKTYAGFANLEFKVSDTLKLQAAARYTDSRRTFVGCTFGDAGLTETFEFVQQAVNGQVFGTPSFVPITPGNCVTLSPIADTAATSLLPTLVTGTLSEDNISWKGGVDWQVRPNILLYANVSKGFKSGSYPTLSGGFVAQYQPVTQESVIAYEAGFKMSFPSVGVRFNAAGFYYDYSDKQFRGKFIDPIFAVIDGLVNIDKSRVRGVEANFILEPARGLTANIGATYLDSKITKGEGVGADGQVGSFVGRRFPYTPKLQLIADAQYEWAIAGEISAFVGGGFLHNSATTSSLGNEDLFRMKGYTIIDARVGIFNEAQNWKLSFWGKNITGEYYWTNVLRSNDSTLRFAGKPITYGITFSKKFN